MRFFVSEATATQQIALLFHQPYGTRIPDFAPHP